MYLEKCYLISPQARDFVASSPDNRRCVHLDTEEEVILTITLDDIIIMFAYSLVESPAFISIIRQLVLSSYPIEWCFNVSLQSYQTRKILLENNFYLDMAGYHMKRDTIKTPPPINRLICKPYSSAFFASTKELMKQSYCPLLMQESDFAIEPNYFQQTNHIQTLLFFFANELVGFTCLDQHYIRDFAIHPTHQNKGFGKEMLTHVLHFMSAYTQEAYLRVMENNKKAIYLYEKMGFMKISAFAEHTKKQAL